MQHWLISRARRAVAEPIAASATVCAVMLFLWLVGGAAGWLSVLVSALACAWLIILPRHSGGGAMDDLRVGSDRSRASVNVRVAAPEVLAAVHDPSFLMRTDGHVEFANDAARDLLQIDTGANAFSAVRAPELHAAVKSAQSQQRERVSVAELRAGVPVERRLTARVVALQGNQGLLLVTFRDRTSEAQLDQMRSDFVANASHELRTPLASLKGFIETLQGPAKDDPVAREQFLDIMQQEASRMSRLIDDLLSLSRIEMRVHVPPRDQVDLALVVREVAELLRPTAGRFGQSVAVSVHEGQSIIRGERDELVQVVQNLVQNAIKYGKKGGTVSLRLSSAGDKISLAVADDGIGIAKEHIPRLTERFYRVSAKDSRERGGTGLGLAIVKHIVNRHRGHMDIASTLGQGTTVTVSFSPSLPARQ